MADVEKLYQKWIAELWNKGKVSVVDELFDPNGVAYYPYFLIGDEPIRGIENYKKFFGLMNSTYREITAEILEISSKDNAVTSLGLVNAVPIEQDRPDDKHKLTISAKVLTRTVFRDGKIIEIWKNMEMPADGRGTNLLEFKNS